jgi:hypothetical protein
MATPIDNLARLMPTVTKLGEAAALAEVEKVAAKIVRHKAANQAEHKALIERLTKPRG